jgi:hypothetical protein
MAAVRPPRGLATKSEFLRLWNFCHNRNYAQLRLMRSLVVGSGIAAGIEVVAVFPLRII